MHIQHLIDPVQEAMAATPVAQSLAATEGQVRSQPPPPPPPAAFPAAGSPILLPFHITRTLNMLVLQVAAVAPAGLQALAQEGRLAAPVELAEQIRSPIHMLRTLEKSSTNLTLVRAERDSL